MRAGAAPRVGGGLGHPASPAGEMVVQASVEQEEVDYRVSYRGTIKIYGFVVAVVDANKRMVTMARMVTVGKEEEEVEAMPVLQVQLDWGTPTHFILRMPEQVRQLALQVTERQILEVVGVEMATTATRQAVRVDRG